MDANPILIEQTRGGIVENRHRGAFVISDSDGRIVASAGDIARPVFPRSAIKSMQAMALVMAGAVERFGITEEQLALACASHGGQDFHVAGVGEFLAEIGLSAADLACGTMQPLNHLAREALKREGREPTPLNHMCSGKHTGMLAVALSLEAPPKGYEQPGHPAQQIVRTAIETIIGETLTMERCASTVVRSRPGRRRSPPTPAASPAWPRGRGCPRTSPLPRIASSMRRPAIRCWLPAPACSIRS